MIGVGENDGSAEFLERFLRQPFDRGRRAHRQELRLFYVAVRGRELAPPRRRRIGFLYFKRKTHPTSVSGENRRPPYAAQYVSGPHAECNGERLAALELLRIRGRKPDGQQNQ